VRGGNGAGEGRANVYEGGMERRGVMVCVRKRRGWG